MVKKKVAENSQESGNKSGKANDSEVEGKKKPGRQKDDPGQSDDVSQGKKEEENVPAAATESETILSTQEKLAEMQDRYLRLSAEFDNYRKRTLREKIELTKTASESVLIRLLPVIDDFERGMKVMESASDCDSMKKGIELIYSKFQSFLVQNGMKEIDALNKEFDVDMHEAVTKIPAPQENMKGVVLDVIEKGYLLTDKVIRFSKVIVGE